MSPKSTIKIMYEQEEKDVDNAIGTLNRIAVEKESASETIRNVIISLDEPFTKIDIIYLLMSKYGIENRLLIGEVLDNLCENQILRYVEIDTNRWAFVKNI